MRVLDFIHGRDDDDDVVCGPTVQKQQQQEESFSTTECSSSQEGDDDDDDDDDGMLSSGSSPAKSVRFVLERNQFHEVVCCFSNSNNDHTMPRKTVSFSLQDNQYYHSNNTVQEAQAQWHDDATLQQWQAEARRDARALFGNVDLKSWLGDAETTSSSTEPLTAQSATPENNNNTAAVSAAISQAYAACSKSKSDRLRRNFLHRDGLEAQYAQHHCLVGLEHFCLTPLRGDPAALRRFILDQGRFMNMANIHSNKTRDALAHVSQCISRPSRLMAQELALAHFRALE